MQLKLVAVGSALVLSFGATACEQPGTTVSNNVSGTVDAGADEPGVANMGAAAVPAGAASTPAAFVTAITASDLFEIQSGKLAQEKGQSAAVKGMGEMLVEEHTKASNELKAKLASSNPPVTLPTALTAEQQGRLQALQGLSGAEFDRRWIAEQTASHQQTLTEINGFLASAEPGPIKDHAAAATGIIQQHLNELNRMK